MRIAFLNSIREYGGGEKWLLRTAVGLRRHGAELLILGEPGSALETRARAEALRFLPVPLRHHLDRRSLAALAGALRKSAPDVLVACNERAVRTAALVARLGGPAPPLVYRNGLQGSFKNKPLNRWLVAPRVARFVVNAAALRDELLAFGWIPPDRVTVLYNGVDPAPIDAADPAGVREALGAPPERVVLLSAARLVPEKGHGVLLEALARLGAGSGVEAWIAGEGPEAESLRARCAALGLAGRVRWLGFRTDLPRLLRAADVFCHPSRREGAPNAVLEAMAAGLAVVAAAAPGTAELVRAEETGLLVPPGDAAALARALERLAGDAGLRRELGTAGRARALTEFSEERSLERWRALLEATAAPPANGAPALHGARWGRG